MNLSLDKRQLCDIQGRLFELAVKNEFDSEDFISKFMNSNTTAKLDDSYDRLQWAGEEYILEELLDEVNEVKKSGKVFSDESMYWIGYIYRYWHYYTNETSREIYAVSDAQKMNLSYLGFHTLDVEMAIDRLKKQ